jgi:hypothetical protein
MNGNDLAGRPAVELGRIGGVALLVISLAVAAAFFLGRWSV